MTQGPLRKSTPIAKLTTKHCIVLTLLLKLVSQEPDITYQEGWIPPSENVRRFKGAQDQKTIIENFGTPKIFIIT